jgi:hypothetical protein
MRTVTLSRTVRHLAALAGSAGRPCPACTGRRRVVVREGQEIPACDFCGRPVPAIRVIHDENFFGNAERLRQLGILD